MNNSVFVVICSTNCPSCGVETLSAVFAGEGAEERARAYCKEHNSKYRGGYSVERYNGENGEFVEWVV